MFYKNIIFVLILVLLSNCSINPIQKKNINHQTDKGYSNKGFAIVYNENLYKQKIVSKKIDNNSLTIFQRYLKTNTRVKVINILNNKTLIATVVKNSSYPSFNNSVLTKRVANELDLDINQPYIEIVEILENSVFIAKKAKTFDQEKNVAVKAPVNNISINDLNESKNKNKEKPKISFSYSIKIADFYFNNTALLMSKRIIVESSIKNPKIKKISDKKYRVYLGPFDNINSLQKAHNAINILKFENIEIIKND
jgi:hypothetical protein